MTHCLVFTDWPCVMMTAFIQVNGAKIILNVMDLFHAIKQSAIENASGKARHITLTQHVELSQAVR